MAATTITKTVQFQTYNTSYEHHCAVNMGTKAQTDWKGKIVSRPYLQRMCALLSAGQVDGLHHLEPVSNYKWWLFEWQPSSTGKNCQWIWDKYFQDLANKNFTQPAKEVIMSPTAIPKSCHRAMQPGQLLVCLLLPPTSDVLHNLDTSAHPQ